MVSPDTKKMIKAREASEILDISVYTFRDLVRFGIFVPHDIDPKDGRSNLFILECVETLMAARRHFAFERWNRSKIGERARIASGDKDIFLIDRINNSRSRKKVLKDLIKAMEQGNTLKRIKS